MSCRMRLNKKIESKLGKPASRFTTGKVKQKRPYELIKDLLDKEGSSIGNLSFRSEEILRKGFKNIHSKP